MASWTYIPPTSKGYSISRCSKCAKRQTWRAVRHYKRKDGSEIPSSCPIDLAQRWALEAGWTNPKRGVWHCPECSAAEKAAEGGN